MKKNPYTLISRLNEFLEIYPIDRGSIWWVEEDVWEDVHPDYKDVRNRQRKGHFGLVARTLDADYPGMVPVMHGHSATHRKTLWYHLQVAGISKDEPERLTHFDVWHRFAFPWREFFASRIYANLEKRCVTADESNYLEKIERLITQHMTNNYNQALEAYRKNPAWKNYFKIDF
jgi:hypothetical protein